MPGCLRQDPSNPIPDWGAQSVRSRRGDDAVTFPFLVTEHLFHRLDAAACRDGSLRPARRAALTGEPRRPPVATPAGTSPTASPSDARPVMCPHAPSTSRGSSSVTTARCNRQPAIHPRRSTGSEACACPMSEGVPLWRHSRRTASAGLRQSAVGESDLGLFLAVSHYSPNEKLTLCGN